MEFYLWFPLYFFLAIIVIRSKKIEIGEFIVIRWNEQPVLFAGVVVVFLLSGFDGLFNILSFFNKSLFSEEGLKILDNVTIFFGGFEALLLSVLIKKFTIKKKSYTWKETPIIRSCVVVFLIFCSAILLKRLI